MPRVSTMSKEEIKQHLKITGAKNLHEYGYPEANSENIMEDYVYAMFFQAMIKENIGQAGASVDDALNELLEEIKEKHEKKEE